MKRIVYLTSFLLLLGICVQAQEEAQAASAASLYNEGLTELKAKNYAAAFPLMQQAIEAADPEDETDAKVIQLAKRNGSIAAYYAGNDERKEDDFEAALEIYNAGIDYAPGFYANYIGRAQALEGKGENAEAIKAYLEAGDVCQKAEKEDKAEKMNSKAENMVAVAWGDDKWDATAEYAKAFLEKSESPEVHYYLAYALKEQGNTDDALAHVEKAIEMASAAKEDRYYMLKAEALEKKGDKEAAIAAYKKVTDAKYRERAEYKVNELSGGK